MYARIKLGISQLFISPVTGIFSLCMSHKNNIHHPIDKHAFAKNCVRFDIPRIVNNCPNCIIDKINTHSLQGFSGYIKAHFLQSY